MALTSEAEFYCNDIERKGEIVSPFLIGAALGTLVGPRNDF
jgi:hypothetical protein